MLHKAGNWYLLCSRPCVGITEVPFILAQVGPREYALVSLLDGNRMKEPVELHRSASRLNDDDLLKLYDEAGWTCRLFKERE